ncbi:hypothetical protein [Anaerocolumna jejuensis]|uniref:hypothetical protein n=1 Tax=Anaerocolumna jejuensis TaxID=259063 RepID=UPI003F7C27E3
MKEHELQEYFKNELIKDNINCLSALWNVKKKNVPGDNRNPFKVLAKKMINKLSQMIIEPFMEQQSMFNLKVTTTLQEIYKEDKKNIYFGCFDMIDKENHITDVLLTFHYYNTNVNADSHLYIIPERISSNEYLLSLLALIKELSVQNVHFLLNLKPEFKIVYKKMINITLSYANNEEIIENYRSLESNQYAVIYSKKHDDTSNKNILTIHDFEIENIINHLLNLMQG